MATDRQILGIDIGATTVKYGLLTDGKLTHRAAEKVEAESNAALIAQLSRIVGRSEFGAVKAVGIGSPGPLNLDSGTIVASANMPAIRDCELLPLLRANFTDKSFRLDNDANAATLGEKFFGAGKGLGDFAVFTLGTGVGGGCIFNGSLQRGINGNFFEVGHIPLNTGRRCGCGHIGCLETVASATGISHSYENATRQRLSAAEIAKRAAAGDSEARRAYEMAAACLGLAAATITQLMNITAFVFTGGVAAAEPLLAAEVKRVYLEHTFTLFHASAKLIFTQGDEDAGILGAAALFLE